APPAGPLGMRAAEPAPGARSLRGRVVAAVASVGAALARGGEGGDGDVVGRVEVAVLAHPRFGSLPARRAGQERRSALCAQPRPPSATVAAQGQQLGATRGKRGGGIGVGRVVIAPAASTTLGGKRAAGTGGHCRGAGSKAVTHRFSFAGRRAAFPAFPDPAASEGARLPTHATTWVGRSHQPCGGFGELHRRVPQGTGSAGSGSK